MKLSERGAIRSAISDGGINLYPAGKLTDIITASLSGDKLDGDFNPEFTAAKLLSVAGPSDPDASEIFKKDISIVADRVSKMESEYRIESVFEKMAKALPAMAKRYYGLDNLEFTTPKVIEYYFEGHSEIYKDADWFAFNVNHSEAKELGVPFGIYFKRSQVTPGMPEYVTMHEANHVMQEKAASAKGYHSYIPWFDEGFADALGRMMLYRATEDEEMLRRVKNFRTEIDVTDPRKVTYHYGEETAILTLLRGRLPFARALMSLRKNDPFSVDWNAYANFIKSGIDPHIAVAKAYAGKKQDHFKKAIERDEKKFRTESDLDEMDLRVLSMFCATQAPATLPASEYKACMWLLEEVEKRPSPYFVDPEIIPAAMRAKVPGWNEETALPASSIPAELWDKSPEIGLKVLIPESAILENFKAGIDKLATMYFIIKRTIGGAAYYEPFGGGLPYRIKTGEIRCSY